jgi:predicted small secreted protein
MIKKILLVAILAAFIAFLTSCQTVQGAGKDIQWMGEKSEEAIDNM